MFGVGFGEILLIMVIALVVLGPEKLPKLAADAGRWLGRARAMARQLSAQLEQEVRLEEVLREQKQRSAQPETPITPATPPVAAVIDIPAPPVELPDNPPAVGPSAPSIGGPSDELHSHGVTPPASPAVADTAPATATAARTDGHV